MGAGRSIVVDILGDATKFSNATKQAQTDANKFGNVMRGIGQGIGIGFTNIVSDAGRAVVDWGVQSVAAFRDEEAGINRLGASLKANVSNWDGNTDAIEKQIGAMVRTTGFSDGEMRDSLSRLVASTHDVTEAFSLQKTAMDLARFKGISLEEASQALIKVEGGQYRALKELGIVLEKGASQTEALAAVQKVAGGQMTAYMDSAAGAADVLENRLADLQEEVGARLNPTFVQATEKTLGLMDALDSDVPLTFADRILNIADALTFLAPHQQVYFDAMKQGKEETIAASVEGAEAWDTGSERIGMALGNISDDSDDAKDDIVADARKIKRSYGEVADYLLGKYNDDFDTALGIVEARADLSAGRHEAAALRKQIASGKLTTKEKKDAEARIRELDVESAAHYEALAGMGALSSAEYDAWLAVVEKLAKGTKGKVHDAYMAAIADIKALRASAREPINVTVNYRKKGQKAGGWGGQAAGGPYAAGEPFWVGEQGPELRVESAPGYTLSHADSMAAVRGRAGGGGGSGGGGPVTIVLQVDGREMARVVDRHLYYEAARAPRSAF